jgi:putative phage-type endonuclease
MQNNFIQGSKEWLKWRGKGIGASDTPIIMGISPFKTPLQLWEEKTGKVSSKPEEYQCIKGHLMEPTARMAYEVHTGLKSPPINLTHPEHTFMRASLDGFCIDKQMIVEIKYLGKKDWSLALEGKLPAYYYYQLQHQMFVAGTKKAHYWAFNGEIGRLIVVYANEQCHDEILFLANNFYQMILNNVAPPLSDRDVKKIEDEELFDKVALYRQLKEKLDADTQTLEALKKDIANYCNHPKCDIDGLRVYKSVRKGNVDYSKIPELKMVNIDKYRKDPKEVISFRDKGGNDVSQ